MDMFDTEQIQQLLNVAFLAASLIERTFSIWKEYRRWRMERGEKD